MGPLAGIGIAGAGLVGALNNSNKTPAQTREFDRQTGALSLTTPQGGGDDDDTPIDFSNGIVSPEMASSNVSSTTRPSSNVREKTSTTPANATVNLADARGKNSIRNTAIETMTKNISLANDALKTVLNAPEDINAVFLCCCFTMGTARTILERIESRVDVSNTPTGIGGEGDIVTVANFSGDAEYMGLRNTFSDILDDILRSCRFRMRDEWLSKDNGVLNWANWPRRGMGQTDFAQYVPKVQAFLARYVASCTTSSLAYGAQRSETQGRDAARSYYNTFLSEVLNPQLGYETLILGELGSPLRKETIDLLQTLPGEILKNPASQISDCMIYVDDHLVGFFSTPEEMSELTTLIAGAINDYVILPEFGNKTLFAPFLFFRKLMVAGALFLTPRELLGSDGYWANLVLVKEFILTKYGKLIEDALNSRNLLVYKMYRHASDPDYLEKNEELIWRCVYNIMLLIGDNTQFANLADQKPLMNAANRGAYFALAPHKTEGGNLVSKVPLDVNTIPLVKFVFTEMFPYKEVSSWKADRSKLNIDYPCLAAKLFLESHSTYDFDARDFRRWWFIGYHIRMYIPQDVNIFPMQALRIQLNKDKYNEYAKDFEDRNRKEREFAKKQRELAVELRDKQRERSVRARAAIQYALNRFAAEAAAAGTSST